MNTNTEDNRCEPSGTQQMWRALLVVVLLVAVGCVISIFLHPEGSVPVRATADSGAPAVAAHGATGHGNPGKTRGTIASTGPFCAGKPVGTVRKPVIHRTRPVSGVAVTRAMERSRLRARVAPGRRVLLRQQERSALAYLQHKMPNAGFIGVRRDPNVPGLLDVETGKPQPVYFDPRNHALIIGLVVNLDNPHVRIAPGVDVPPAAFGP